MNLFSEESLSDFLSQRLNDLKEEVRLEPKNKLLNVNENEYIDYLVSKYDVTPVNFQWENISVNDREERIPADRFPYGFYVSRGQYYSKQVLTFFIPFIGESKLLRLKPSTFLLWSLEVSIKANCICFDVVNWRDDKNEIKRIFESEKRNIQSQLENVKNDVVRFNDSLLNKAKEIVKNRKEQHLKMSNILESLGVPVKKTQNVSETFSIPINKTKPIIKPTTTDDSYTPEPSLDENVYSEILKICYQTGVEMERHPSIYFDKDEETLRDHFLMVLSPHFQSVTGETFNKKGKTDILIRHDQSNVFVAECKFWRGQKSFLSTIDQILKYLTWRDSKAAIICFVKNKNIDVVLPQIEVQAMQHKCFTKFNGTKAHGWFDFDFRLNTNNPRGVKLSILCFHFPE